MAKKDTAGFLKFMNAFNEGVARMDQEPVKSGGGLDDLREERQAERRARLGQLRARPKHKSKTNRVRSVFGYTDMS